MWSTANAPQPVYGIPPPPPQQQQQQQQQVKHDIFVGNLAFNTTEEQLHQAFSEIGSVLNVRLVMDMETGKPRGFAFVEFEDPQAALSAIRNMNDYELNGRRLRVNFSNSSHLEQLAAELGMDLQTQRTQGSNTNAGGNNNSSNNNAASPAGRGTSAVAESLKNMSKAEMYDVVAKLKDIADRDQDEARRLISGHPQLPEALLFLMSKLDMVKTPVAIAEAPVIRVAADPRAQQRAADPRAARVDPRVDPRTRVAAAAPATAFPPPPPPPPSNPPPPPAGLSHLDPGLIQQVMSLTPQQIQQLPPDKQQSILQLRQQVTGNNQM